MEIKTDCTCTDTVTGGLVMPFSAAVMLANPAVVVPVAKPVAGPVEIIVAEAVLELAQVTLEVILAVEPSE